MAYTNYDEGTFTPTIVGQAVAGTTTYTSQNGYYRRIGNIVIAQMTIVGTAATGTGNALIGGLPFTIKNQTNGAPIGAVFANNNAGWTWPAGTTSLSFNGIINTLTANIGACGTGAGTGLVQMANAAFNWQFTLIYEV